MLLLLRVGEICSPEIQAESKDQSIENEEVLDQRYGADLGQGCVLGFVQSDPTQETVLEEESSCKAGPSREPLKCGEGTSKRWRARGSSSICVVEC